MVIILKPNADPGQLAHLTQWLVEQNIDPRPCIGETQTILGLVGDTSGLDISSLQALDIVQDVTRVSEPYKNANRKFHPQDTAVETGNGRIGAGGFQVIAGPCSVEGEEQIVGIAKQVKAAGATLLRGGAFKPRTSPYAFQGLHGEGIRLLLLAKAETGLPIVSEIMDAAHIPLFEDVDVLQIGARNMQNFELLKQVGALQKPVLLKRGPAATLQELLMSAEYIMAGGNSQVILCERGIRTFETATRNTLDLSAVPVLKELSHLPVVIDPSHGTGYASLVPSMALAATASGADGLVIEVHNNPAKALSDGPQSLTPDAFATLMRKISRMRNALEEIEQCV